MNFLKIKLCWEIYFVSFYMSSIWLWRNFTCGKNCMYSPFNCDRWIKWDHFEFNCISSTFMFFIMFLCCNIFCTTIFLHQFNWNRLATTQHLIKTCQITQTLNFMHVHFKCDLDTNCTRRQQLKRPTQHRADIPKNFPPCRRKVFSCSPNLNSLSRSLDSLTFSFLIFQQSLCWVYVAEGFSWSCRSCGSKGAVLSWNLNLDSIVQFIILWLFIMYFHFPQMNAPHIKTEN